MKTNRTHRKGGKSKAVSQGQTVPTPKHLAGLPIGPQHDNWPRTNWIKVQRNGPGKLEYEIGAGAEALAEIRVAGLTLTDLEPAISRLVRKMPPCTWQYVDYPELIAKLLSKGQDKPNLADHYQN